MAPGALIGLFTALDALALALLVAAWAGLGLVIERPVFGRRSVTVMMAETRRAWMGRLARRHPRVFDGLIIGNLRQSTAFFASSALLAIGGVLTVAGNVEALERAAGGLLVDRPAEALQVKLIAAALLLGDAFLRFVWSNRVFGYCAVVMAAVPEPDEPGEDPYPVARQAAELNIRAAYNFNRGLRSIYFALAALAWTLGAVALMVATAVCVWTLLEREFSSRPHHILAEGEGRDD